MSVVPKSKSIKLAEAEKRALPFFIDFVKFCAAFSFVVAVGLLTLSLVSTSV